MRCTLTFSINDLSKSNGGINRSAAQAQATIATMERFDILSTELLSYTSYI